MKKQVVVIGLGRFGSSVGKELYQMGHDVLGIDLQEKNVQDMLGHVTYAVKSDATNEEVLKELGVSNFDVAVVAVGSDIQASILVTVLLKEMGIPFIVARAKDDLHGTTLERIGADKVVYPEQEMGRRLAHTGFDAGVLDYMEVAPNYGITKLRPPERMVKHTLEEVGLASPRDKYHLAVLAIRRGREYFGFCEQSEIKDLVTRDRILKLILMKQTILIHGSPYEKEFYNPKSPSPSNGVWFP